MNPRDKNLLHNTALMLIKAGAGAVTGCPPERILRGLKLESFDLDPAQLDGALGELRILGMIRFEEDPLNAALRYYFPTAEGLKHLQRLGLD